LDLSSWELAFIGAEPIHPATLERFAAAFAPCGFKSSAFYPCYGLAEATLMVSGSDAGDHKAFHDKALSENQVELYPAVMVDTSPRAFGAPSTRARDCGFTTCTGRPGRGEKYGSPDRRRPGILAQSI
jgi:acyl-CoA synthetase (AMP-forming)/AMP-acid ligase II